MEQQCILKDEQNITNFNEERTTYIYYKHYRIMQLKNKIYSLNKVFLLYALPLRYVLYLFIFYCNYYSASCVRICSIQLKKKYIFFKLLLFFFFFSSTPEIYSLSSSEQTHARTRAHTHTHKKKKNKTKSVQILEFYSIANDVK
jgi:hypothetical protein